MKIDIVGRRIRLLKMHDPNPIPVGTLGTITWVNHVKSMGFTQIAVAWDNGRTLMIAHPPDHYELVHPDDEK